MMKKTASTTFSEFSKKLIFLDAYLVSLDKLYIKYYQIAISRKTCNANYFDKKE